jgi:hypothetical protein
MFKFSPKHPQYLIGLNVQIAGDPGGPRRGMAVFLNRASRGIPQGLSRDPKRFQKIFNFSVFTNFPHLLLDFTWEGGSFGHYAVKSG